MLLLQVNAANLLTVVPTWFAGQTFVTPSLFVIEARCLPSLLCQDVYSYSMEYARSIDGNNYVTVLMNDNDWSLQQAADHVGLQ